jgi:hypothetical protein
MSYFDKLRLGGLNRGCQIEVFALYERTVRRNFRQHVLSHTVSGWWLWEIHIFKAVIFFREIYTRILRQVLRPTVNSC